ncbi:MAG: di-trans,poly-cis-decaprenylcistransferase [Pseudomonadales bacterium]|nr:di-trans,poly-cis-decaprenylcistransferase [Pseudomonadales bacterium]
MTLAPDSEAQSPLQPKHIAMIMDGNNRWAKARDLPGIHGHEAGEQAVRVIVEAVMAVKIEVLTLFAFSSENWRRPQEEVHALMRLFLKALQQRLPDLQAQGVRLRFIGDMSAFEPTLRSSMQTSMQSTQGNTRLTLNIAVNYGGQWDLAAAALDLVHAVARGEIRPCDVTPEHFAQRLCMADLPPVDLLIRTGGEHRLSNFVLWQAAYAELYFTDCLWPDFDQQALATALEDYASRERRFGRTSEQIKAMHRA